MGSSIWFDINLDAFIHFDYCKFGNFRDIFFANSVIGHICDVKKSRLGHDLPISVQDRVILPFCENFIFTKLRISRKKNSRKIPNLQY